MAINLDDLFSVENILKSKGFNVSEIGNSESLILKGIHLLRNPAGGRATNRDVELVYEIFNSSVLRKELKSYIENKSTGSISERIIELVNHLKFNNDRQAYSTTFEWYIGEMMVRDFAALSSSFGVKISDLYRRSNGNDEAGDFDVISILRNLGVAYFECKTGRFNKEKILKCVERSVALHCEFSIMLIDNGINENALIQKLNNTSYPMISQNALKKISLSNNSTFIYSWMNCYFINSSENISSQINIALRINEAKKIASHYTIDCSKKDYQDLGYDVIELLVNKC